MTADRIKALREARGWTQAELARKMNDTKRYQFMGTRTFYAIPAQSG
jgi:transcriptional regulator with XRE-family HTH domain